MGISLIWNLKNKNGIKIEHRIKKMDLKPSSNFIKSNNLTKIGTNTINFSKIKSFS
jgi:hypothetical protein